MNRNFLTWIALRYFRSKKRTGLISFTSYVSVVGIALGGFAMLVALSVFKWFRSRNYQPGNRSGIASQSYRNRIIGRGCRADPKDPERRSHSGYLSVCSEKSILSSSQMEAVVRIKSPRKCRAREQLSGESAIIRGGANFISATSDLPGIVVGYQLGRQTGVYPGDTLNIINPLGIGTGLNIPVVGRFAVTGVFRLDLFDYDENMAFIELAEGQKIFEMGAAFSGIDIRLEIINFVAKVKQRLTVQLGSRYEISAGKTCIAHCSAP
jgi:lipoprotein-releasing system permease protein